MSKKIGDVLVVDFIDVMGTITLFILGLVLFVVGGYYLNNNDLIGFMFAGVGFVIFDQYIGTKQCPHCQTYIDENATKCKHCHSMQETEEQ